MTRIRSPLSLAAALSVVALSACDTTADPREDDAAPVTAVGQSIWIAAVQSIVASNDGGGFVPAPPAGSTCQWGSARYTLTVATRLLAWQRCEGQAPQPYQLASGSRSLTEAEFGNLSVTLGKLKVAAPSNQCGADKPIIGLSVTTARGTQEYGDSFYACTIKNKPLLESNSLDQLLGDLGQLAK